MNVPRIFSHWLVGKADSHGCSTVWNPDSPNYLARYGVYIYKPDRFKDFMILKLKTCNILPMEVKHNEDVYYSYHHHWIHTIR